MSALARDDPLVDVIAQALHDGAPWEYVDENVRDSYRQDAHAVLRGLVRAGYRVDVDRTPTVAPEHLTPPTVADGLDAGSRDSTGRTRWRLSYRDGAVFADLPGVPIGSVRINGQHYAPAPEPEWRPFVVRDGIDGPAVTS